jgi:hypothetical protein
MFNDKVDFIPVFSLVGAMQNCRKDRDEYQLSKGKTHNI